MKTIDKAAKFLIDKAKEDGVELAWDRLEKQQPQCGFGLLGICCRNCNMGPCRIDPFGGVERGVCGATADVIVARNLCRMIAAGAAAHSDHGRDLILTLLLMAEGEAKDYKVTDSEKLKKIAKEYGIDVNRSDIEIAKDLAKEIIKEFGIEKGYIQFIERAPEKRKEIWKKLGILPRGIDREIVEIMHRTHIGVDNDYVNLLLHGLRTALSDGWGGSMIATEVSDILFGTPKPLRTKANLGVLKEDHVNIIVHGHEPILSEMIALAAEDEELIKLAKDVGAKGINVCGMCCTGNELLMRKGIPIAGNFLHQELAIVTGVVDAMIVDVQCIMPAITEVAKCYHTLIISTSPKAKFPGAVHIEFKEEKALEIAKEIVRKAIENFKNRKKELIRVPHESMELIAGFSYEVLADKLDALIDAIKRGDIRGVAALVGCNNPKVPQDRNHVTMAEILIKNNIFVVETGCSAIACAKAGLLLPEAAENAGESLRNFCKSLGIPPVLHMGSCVDISRILVLVSEIAKRLNVDISDLPIAAAAPEWMSEKAVSIGAYAVASGIFTVLGTVPPVLGSKNVTKLLTEDLERVVGARFAVETDPEKAAELIIKHIEEKRKKLGI